MRALWLIVLLLLPVPSWAQTTYYVSPSGLDSNNGLTTATPFLTIAHAINTAGCGNTVSLMDGTYGTGTASGRVLVETWACLPSAPLTIRATNQRQAKVTDTGLDTPVHIRNSAYIVIDGLYLRNADNASGGSLGMALRTYRSNHVTIRNTVARNANRYANTPMYSIFESQDVTLEDNEAYIFARHCVTAWHGERVVVRRAYCNPRGGRIAGGVAGTLTYGDAVMSMYPCRDCILENSIAEGRMYLNEMNATFGSSIVTTGNKILGSICVGCRNGNGIFIQSRNSVGLNNTPQNITVRDVAIVDYESGSSGIRVSDCAGTSGCTIDKVTVIMAPSGTAIAGGDGVTTDDGTNGVSAASNIATITDSVVVGNGTSGGRGFAVTGFNTWSGDRLISYNNATSFSPTPPSNWTNTLTTDPTLGSCKFWIPSGSTAKGSGASGSDRGATILYRYVDGTLTTTPLWDPITGEFPHGAADPDGTNRVAGDSLYDFHTRHLNLSTCPFPSGYGDTGGGGGGGGSPSTVTRGTTAASGLTTTATPLTWSHTISSSQDRLQVCVGLWHSAANVGSVSGIDVSGQAMSLVKRQVTSPDAYRAVELWTLASPTSGSRTITVTLTGNISGALGRSTEFDVTSGLNTASGASTSGAATSLSVTALTNTNERVEDCTVSSKSVTYTHGDNQTGDTDLDHATQSLRLATSTQNGSDGGVMSNVTGGTVVQAKVAVSYIAGTPDPPLTAVLTQEEYQICDGYGTEAGVACSTKNTARSVGPEGLVRVRVEIAGSVDTTEPFGVVLYCDRNGGGYAKAIDSFGSNVFRLYGAGPNSTVHPIPESLSALTQKLGGSNFVQGKFLRDAASTFVVPMLTVGQRVEAEWALQLNATAGDVISCRARKDDGSVLDAYSQTATINVRPNAANAGF